MCLHMSSVQIQVDLCCAARKAQVLTYKSSETALNLLDERGYHPFAQLLAFSLI